MKTKLHHGIIVFLLCATFSSRFATAHAQGTAFTYQGRLNSGGGPASGSYDLAFTIYDANAPAGNWIAGPVTNAAVAVSNGLFTVTLDFGTGVFAGNARWLEIAVRTNGGASFTTLTPRQAIIPTPYAIYAASAATAASASSVAAGNISGTVALAQLPPVLVTNGAAGIALTGTFAGNYGGSFYGNGSGLTGLNASALTSGTVPMAELPATNFWQTGGNTVAAGQQLGSLNNQPLQLVANGVPALRLLPDTSGQGAPNVIGGSAANYIANGVVGSVIGGGGATSYFGQFAGNSISGNYSVIAGGQWNTNYSIAGMLGGGQLNLIGAGIEETLCGGQYNVVGSSYASVVGGTANHATGLGSFIGGGGLGFNYGLWGNTASGFDSVVGGGILNTASGTNSTIAGGYYNTASTNYSTVAGGDGNNASGIGAFIGGGGTDGSYVLANTASGNASVVGGGVDNQATNRYSVVGGGYGNTSGGDGSFIGAGYGNTASGSDSFIGDGGNNIASATYATVPGGNGNIAGGYYSFAAGNNAIAQAAGAFVWADSLTNTFNAFAQPGATGVQDSFNVRSTGGFYIVTGINTANGQATSEAYLAANSTSWAVMSDRNAKKDFAPVDYQAVLAKLAGVPIQQWHYKWENAADVVNIGPMAQDFKHAFYPGRDDKSITTLEFDGVELAAIQGLNQKLEEQKAENTELKEQNDALAARLNELEAAVKSLAKTK